MLKYSLNARSIVTGATLVPRAFIILLVARARCSKASTFTLSLFLSLPLFLSLSLPLVSLSLSLLFDFLSSDLLCLILRFSYSNFLDARARTRNFNKVLNISQTKTHYVYVIALPDCEHCLIVRLICHFITA